MCWTTLLCIFLQFFKSSSRFVLFAFLYALLRFLIWRLIYELIQEGSVGLILIYRLGMH